MVQRVLDIRAICPSPAALEIAQRPARRHRRESRHPGVGAGGFFQRGCRHEIKFRLPAWKSPGQVFSVGGRLPAGRLVVIRRHGQNRITGRRPIIRNDRPAIAQPGRGAGLLQGVDSVAAPINADGTGSVPAEHDVDICIPRRSFLIQTAQFMPGNQHFALGVQQRPFSGPGADQ